MIALPFLTPKFVYLPVECFSSSKDVLGTHGCCSHPHFHEMSQLGWGELLEKLPRHAFTWCSTFQKLHFKDVVLTNFNVLCCVYMGRSRWSDFLDTLRGVVPWGTAI